jgi:glutathione S-transferase
MLTLYDFGNSVCCQKVRITMRAKGLEWTAVPVNLFTSEQYSADYLKLNPKGVVPTLVHEGKPVIESTLICEYLDDVFPDPPLVPKDPWLRSRMRVWSKLVDEGLFEGVAEISFSAMFRERMRTMSEEMRQSRFRNVGDPKRGDRVRSTFELGVESPFVLYGVVAYEKAFKLMEQALEDDGPWLVGATPTLGDISMMPFFARLEYLGLLDLWLEGRPHVQAWWAMAREWPYYRSGLHDLITEAEYAEMQAHGPGIREGLAGLLHRVRAEAH